MIAETKAASVQYALACEDVRREDNGKLILIGVFGNSIRISEFPAKIRLQLVMRLIPHKESFNFSIRVSLDNDPAFVMKGTADSPSMIGDITATPPFEVNVVEPCNVVFEFADVAFDDGPDSPKFPWRQLLTLPIEINPVSTSS